MIIFYHNHSKITAIVSSENQDFSAEINENIVHVLLNFSNKYHDEILVWCHENQRNNLNVEIIENLFHHKKLMFSYNPSPHNYFTKELGYIEDSPFININKQVSYPTWQMSSSVGAIHATTLNSCSQNLKTENNFDYFLNSFAKRAFDFGLFCYSNPKLLKSISIENYSTQASISELFIFTKQHYRFRWVFLLFFNLLIFEKKIHLLPFLKSFFYYKRKFNFELLDKIPLESTKYNLLNPTIDVLIPTIGRKEFLFEVLKNLNSQTYFPENVIIIEQNPQINSKSELDFITNQKWNFTIKHHFTHQTGACNARNVGMQLIESDFCFFADDDIVFQNDLIEKAMKMFQSIGNESFLVACHLKTQLIIPKPPKQFPVFGAGHAFLKSTVIKDLKFNMGFEYGFGEDADFGMQLRNKGVDVLYISTFTILHLKAPMGGFRTKPVLKWQNEIIQPKPSPTVMLFRILYDTKEQLNNYKMILFIKNLNKNFFLNPFKYIKNFNKKWESSMRWAIKLKGL